MSIHFELPQEIEEHLRNEFVDLDQAAKEAFLMESYREGQLSVGKIAEILGKGVIETHEWLSLHGIPLNYTLDELQADRTTIAKLFPDAQR